MAKRKNNYKSFRLLTIVLTTIMLPFGTFVGFQFGAQNYTLAVAALGAQTALTFIQSYIWWLTLEKSGKS